MTVQLKVITLNCWALPYPVLCKHRNERINAIIEYLGQETYDIVILEEIWVKSDFQKLREKLQQKLPFSHYFYSGTIGSGVCVFSRHLITETSYHRFQLNGHPHKIFHGDWFGGKGVGLCKIQEEGLDINVYCTHFHAEYNSSQDEYEAHRLAQAFELSQFIRSTNFNCDMAILAGDLNLTSSSLGYMVITQLAQLKDTWAEKENTTPDETAGTCDVPYNTYTGSVKAGCPNGERIDYVLYNVKPNCKATVTDCRIGIGKIPALNTSYSDHEPVIATIAVGKSEVSCDTIKRSALGKEVKETLQETLVVLNKGVNQCLNEEKFFQLVVFLLSLILYFLNSYLDLEFYSSNIIVAVTLAAAKLFLAFAIGFSVWIALIVKRGEFHALIACKEDIMKLLKM